jgi:Fe-S-cluster containining protein
MSTLPLPRLKPRREDIKPDEVLCDYCTAKCCRYFALPIETPDCREDFEYIRWYLLHDQASVFTEGETWYLMVSTNCQHLQSDNRCGIYDTRPPICREYSTKDCEYEDLWVYERYLETAEQVAEYAEALLSEEGKDIRSARPKLLPVIS